MLNRLLVAAVALATTTISAQETENIEEIVVTATHRETNLMETPQAISAVSGQMIEELGVTNMQGLFRNITGLNMSEGASASNNRYAVRGVSSQTGTESYQQTYAAVSVYLDDVPMTSAQGPARQFGGNLFDIDRVEVLKGPQGTLFGEGSVGGTIRFIQNKPSLDGIDWKVRASANQNEESSDWGHRLDGMLNLPVSDSFALRLTAFDENRAGWFENEPNNEEDTNSEQSTGGRIAALWVVSDRLSVEGSFFTVQTDTEGWVAGQTRYKEQLNVRIPGVTPQSTDQVDVFALNADYDFDWATLQLAASFMDRAAHSQREYAETVAAFFDWFIQFNIVARAGDNPDEIPALLAEGWQLDLANPAVRTNQLAFNNDSTAESERTTFEAKLISDSDGPWRWLVGTFMKDSDDFRRDFQPFLMQPWLADATRTQAVYRAFYSDPSNEHVDTLNELSVFGEASYAVSPAIELTAGLRWTDMEQTLEDSTVETADKVFSPKVGASYWMSDRTLTYFNITTGFRPGNVNLGQEFNARQLSGAGDAVLPDLPPFAGNPEGLTGNQAAAIATSRITYDGDSVTNYELGLKTRLFDNRLNLTTSIYYFDWQDTILGFQQLNLPTINKNYNANAGAAHSQGIEMDIVARPSDQWRINLGFDFNEAELDEQNNDNPPGTKLPYSPEWSGHLTVDYSHPLPRDMQLNLMVNHTLVAEQKQSLNVGTPIVPKRQQTDLRVNLRGAGDRWQATFFALNLTNEDEIVLDCAIQLILREPCFAYQTPRVMGVEFTLRP